MSKGDEVSTIGVLDTGRTFTVNGKLIDEWVFHTPFDSLIKNDKEGRFNDWQKKEAKEGWVFKVSIHKGSNGMKFIARCKALRNEIEHTDINELKRLCEEAVAQKHDILDGIRWEDWLEVIVTGRKGKLSVSYSKIVKGFNSKFPGAEFTMERGGSVKPFPKSMNDTEYEKAIIDREIWGSSDPTTKSFIQDTKENREALEHVINMIEGARMKLASILSQDVVNENIPVLIGNNLLLTNEVK